MKKIHHFIGKFDMSAETVRIEDKALSHQLQSVLRVVAGELIVLGNGAGEKVIIEITGYEKNVVNGIVRERKNQARLRDIVLYCALLKRSNFEWVVEKATELGVTKIVPLITERTVKQGFNRVRLETIMREAAEQSERFFVPELSEPLALPAALQMAHEKGETVFFAPEGRTLSGVKINNFFINFFVGPEGGWSEREVELVQKMKATIVNLGSNMLKAETAAIVASFWASQL